MYPSFGLCHCVATLDHGTTYPSGCAVVVKLVERSRLYTRQAHLWSFRFNMIQLSSLHISSPPKISKAARRTYCNVHIVQAFEEKKHAKPFAWTGMWICTASPWVLLWETRTSWQLWTICRLSIIHAKAMMFAVSLPHIKPCQAMSNRQSWAACWLKWSYGRRILDLGALRRLVFPPYILSRQNESQSRLSRVTRKARANDPSKAALMPWQENQCVMKPNQATAEQFEHSQHPVHKLCCKLHPVFGALPPKLPGLEERVPVSKEFIWRAGPLW